jgi:hypothetical protein
MLEQLFLLYIVLSAVLLWLRHRGSWREWWVRFVLAVSFPVLGYLLPIFWSRRWHERNARRLLSTGADIFNETDLVESSHSGIYRKPEAEKEMNIVPLEEALLVNDLSTRRRVMIDLLKKDSLDYLEVLQMAVGNEDTETSHYAVSAIMEIKRKLTLTLQELAVKYEEDKSDPHLLKSYADVLKGYMRSGFMDERTMVKHKHTYIEVLGRYNALVPEDTEAFEEKLDTELELREYSSAEQTARQYLKHFPRSENPYLALIRVYYTVRSFGQLSQTLEELKRSPVRLSSRALTIVRFWSEGVQRNEYPG